MSNEQNAACCAPARTESKNPSAAATVQPRPRNRSTKGMILIPGSEFLMGSQGGGDIGGRTPSTGRLDVLGRDAPQQKGDRHCAHTDHRSLHGSPLVGGTLAAARGPDPTHADLRDCGRPRGAVRVERSAAQPAHPVRTSPTRTIVVCPTATPSTSVIAFNGRRQHPDNDPEVASPYSYRPGAGSRRGCTRRRCQQAPSSSSRGVSV